jgi:hypothetical protein
MIPEMDEKRDVAIILNDINYEDEWEDDYMQRRYIVYTLRFTAKTYFYGPYSQSDIIKKAIVYETIGDAAVNRRTIKRTYTPVATQDQDGDGDVDTADTCNSNC